MNGKSVLAMNTVPEFWCYDCMDFGAYPIHDASTDAVLGWHECDNCKNRVRIYKFEAERNWKWTEKELADLPPF